MNKAELHAILALSALATSRDVPSVQQPQEMQIQKPEVTRWRPTKEEDEAARERAAWNAAVDAKKAAKKARHK